MLVDQHAAHERLVLERMRRALEGEGGKVSSQALLLPQVVELDEPACDRLETRIAELQAFGLELERFGPSAMLVRATPAMLEAEQQFLAQLRPLLEQVESTGFISCGVVLTASLAGLVAEVQQVLALDGLVLRVQDLLQGIL